MRVAMALLVDEELCNSLARITMKCRDYGFGLRVLRLPPHVSLKQPFIVPDFERFETYFDEFAASIEQQTITFDGFQFWAYPEGGVVSARVVKDGHLRELHTRLNSELEHRFGNTQAEHDGDDYAFHLTVAIGPYREESLPQLQTDLAELTVDEHTVSSKLAMFIYEESMHPDSLYGVREFGTYKILPLRKV